MAYDICVRAGWQDGIHDCRALQYQHPWLVICGGATIGCWSRSEARRVLREMKGGT